MNYENQRQNGPPEREYCRTEKKWGAVVDNFGRNTNPNNRYRQHRNRHRHGHQQQQHQQNSRQQLSPSVSRRAGPINHDDRRMQHYHHNDNHRLFHNYDDVEEERQFDNKRHQRHHKYNSYHHNNNQNDSFHNYRQDDFSDYQHQYDGKGKTRTNQNYNTNIDNNNDRANNNNNSSSSNNNNIIGSSSGSSKKLDRRLQYRSPSNKKCLDKQHQRQRYQQQKQQRQGTLIELPYITNRKQHTNTSTGSDVKRRRVLMGSDTKTAHFMSTNRTTATTTPKNVTGTRWGPRVNNRKHKPTLEQQQSKSKPAEDEPNFSARSSLDQLSQTFSQSSEITFGNNVARAKATNDSHVLSSPLNSEKKFSCLDCGVIFPKWMMCLHHMRQSHPKLELPTCQATKWQKKGHSVTTCPKTKQENKFRYGCPDNQEELKQRCLIVDSNKFSTSPSKYLKECNPSLLNTEGLKQGYRITNSKHVVKVLQRENVAAVTLTGLTRQTANTKAASISDGGDTSKVTENFEKALKDHQHQNQGLKTAVKDVIDLVSEDDSDDDCDDHDPFIQNVYSNDHVAKNSSNKTIIDASKKPNNSVNNDDVIMIDNDEISIIEILDDDADDDDDDDDNDNGVEEDDEVIVLEQKKVIKREIERRIIDNNHDDNFDDAQIIGSTGKNALSDFPHSREDCVIYPLEEGDPMLYCQNCYCFVCDVEASKCTEWHEHSRATRSESKWRSRRSQLRNKRKKPERVLQQLDDCWTSLDDTLSRTRRRRNITYTES